MHYGITQSVIQLGKTTFPSVTFDKLGGGYKYSGCLNSRGRGTSYHWPCPGKVPGGGGI